VIVELQLRLAPARRWDQVAITGPDWAKVTAFATRLAYDDAVPKRLLSLLEASFGASFKPLKKWLKGSEKKQVQMSPLPHQV
jgi:hypothetical protein